jgi:hypothetical protein
LKPIRFQKLEPKFSNISAPPTTNQLLDGSIGAQTSEGDAEDVLTQREGTRRFASVSDVSDGAGTVQARIPWAASPDLWLLVAIYDIIYDIYIYTESHGCIWLFWVVFF